MSLLDIALAVMFAETVHQKSCFECDDTYVTYDKCNSFYGRHIALWMKTVVVLLLKKIIYALHILRICYAVIMYTPV